MSIGTKEAPPGPDDSDGSRMEYVNAGLKALQRFLSAQIALPGVNASEVVQPDLRRNLRAGYGLFRPPLSKGMGNLGHMALGGPWRDTNELMW